VCAWKLVPTHYSLKSGGKAKVVKSNAMCIESLLTNSVFHFEVAALDDHICTIISNMWFSNGLESYGVKHTNPFSPILLPMLTLLMVMVSSSYQCPGFTSHAHGKIKFCLIEWKTG